MDIVLKKKKKRFFPSVTFRISYVPSATVTLPNKLRITSPKNIPFRNRYVCVCDYDENPSKNVFNTIESVVQESIVASEGVLKILQVQRLLICNREKNSSYSLKVVTYNIECGYYEQVDTFAILLCAHTFHHVERHAKDKAHFVCNNISHHQPPIHLYSRENYWNFFTLGPCVSSKNLWSQFR